MKLRGCFIIVGCMMLLAGCSSPEPKGNFLANAPLVVEGVDGTRQIILFPEYFLMEDYKLKEHGHIPRTGLIGAGLTTDLELAAVRVQFNDLLHYHHWETDRMEIGRQSFRSIASKNGERVEIRAVQGSSGPTEIFLLYTPSLD